MCQVVTGRDQKLAVREWVWGRGTCHTHKPWDEARGALASEAVPSVAMETT